MKKITIILTLLMSFGYSQIIMPDTSKMSYSEKMMWYQNEKKSLAIAMIFNSLVPTAGHAYVGIWGRGLMFKVAEVSSLIGTIYIMESDDYALIPPIILLVVEYYDLYNKTKNYNKELYNNLFGNKGTNIDIGFVPQKNGASLTLTYNFK